MNRCFHLLAFCAVLMGFAPVWAQMPTLGSVRPFPAHAERAILQVVQPPTILLNGQPERLSPGSRIRDPNNMLVLSGTLIGQNLLVHYVREPLGLIHEVWILTDAEAQRPTPAKSKP
jgi:hypothetical protein